MSNALVLFIDIRGENKRFVMESYATNAKPISYNFALTIDNCDE